MLSFGSDSSERVERCFILINASADLNIQCDNDKSTLLHAAAEADDHGLVEILLKYKANPEIYDRKGNTALHVAASYGSMDVVALFVEHMGKSSAVDCLSEDLSRPLHFAAARGQESTCGLLLDSGADVNTTDAKGHTALHRAASKNRGKKIMRLLEAGALIKARDKQGYTPLHLAAMNENTYAIKVLLQNGASTSSRDDLGLTALLSAAAAGCDKSIPLLVKDGADVNASSSSGASCLHLAAAGNHRKARRLLLSLGAKMNTTDDSGATALDSAKYAKSKRAQIILKYAGAKSGEDLGLHLPDSPIWPAVRTGDHATLQALMDEHYNLDLRHKLTGQTPIHLAASVGRIDTISFLMEKGANISARNTIGETALHYAVHSRSIETIDFLVGKGLDPHVENFPGSRPLHIACFIGAEQIVSRLLSMKGNVGDTLKSASAVYGTPLWAASSSGYVSIVRDLVEAGAFIETSHSYVGTPLFASCYNGHIDVVKYLLSIGASTVSEGTRFRTAMELADACGRFEIVEIWTDADAAREVKDDSAEGGMKRACQEEQVGDGADE